VRIVFIGCVAFSEAALSALFAMPAVDVVGVVTRSRSPANSDFRDLSRAGEDAGVPVFLADGRDDAAMAAWIAARGPDIAYCFGWSRLLPPAILDVPPRGVVGFHPARLPFNRGRHPLIWALALGLEETATTFFLMDQGADTGAILSQRPIPIASDDDAASLYAKMTRTALDQLRELSADLAHGRETRRPQPPGAGNAWRQRSAQDGRVDWRMTARSIHNLIRALATPYPGAHCLYRGREVALLRSAVVACTEHHLEPGKVLDDASGRLVVKCGEDAVALLAHGFDPVPGPGSYL